MRTILITGSNGLVGQYLVNLLLNEKSNYKIVGLSKGENRSGRLDFEYYSIDLTQKKELLVLLKKTKPDVIVNTAAITQVDYCEENKKLCDLVNVEMVKWLSDFAEKSKTHLIHLSTDFIFDGEKGHYKEQDYAYPLSYYGKSKLKSEEILINSKGLVTILRTILVFGKVNEMSRTNIVLWVIDKLKNNEEIKVVNDQFRMPTYAKDLALACKLAIDKKAEGVFHISSNTLYSVFDIAIKIAETFNLNTKLISPISSKKLNQRARRPSKTGFDLTKSIDVLGFPSVTFEDGLKRFKQTLI